MTSLLARTAATIGLGVASGLLVTTPSSPAAFAAPAGDEPGSHTLSGRITVEGALAQSADASLWKLDTATGKYQSYTNVYASWQTGEYSFSVPDGTYRLHTDQDDFVGEWYDDAYFADEAQPIIIAGADVRLPVIDLANNAYVSGTITGDGSPLTCPELTWYRKDHAGVFRPVANGSVGNGETRYTAGLDPGTYKLQGWDGCGGFRPRWYGGSVTKADATPIIVSSGSWMTIGNIDLRDAPTIFGTLRRPDGTPVRKVQVTALVAADLSSGSYWDVDRSDQQGRFELQVGGVSTKLRIYDPESLDGADQWYQSWDSDGSPTITLGPDDDDLDLGDVTVQPGGTLTGTVTRAGGTPTVRTQVKLYRADELQQSVFTDRQGRYRITDLVPGDYKLEFGQAGLSAEFHDDSPTLAGATPIAATNAATTTVNAELSETSTDLPAETDLYGFVTGPGGRPEPGVRVCAQDVPTNPYPEFCRRSSVTDVHGRYVFTTLDNDSTGTSATHYKLRFDRLSGIDGEAGLVPVFSGGALSYDDAAPVPLPEATDPVRSDIEMDAYGMASGVLTTSHGDPPSHGTVQVYDASGTRIRDIRIDENGGYAAALLPGTYRVLFSGYEESDESHGYHPYVPVWWHNRDSLESATVVTIGEDDYLGGIDAALHDHMVASSPPTISGTPTVGSTLEAEPGQWNGESPAHFTYSWRRDGTPMGSGSSYVVSPADQGHELRVRVTAEIFIDEDNTFTGTATSAGVTVAPGGDPPSPPPAVVTHSSSTEVTGTFTRKKHHKPSRITLRIEVTNSGGGVTPGMVKVTEGTLVRRAALELVDGRAVLVIKRPSRGKHTYLVTFLGTSTIRASSGQVTVRAR